MKMPEYYSPARYKELWKDEVAAPKGHKPLAALVENWFKVLKAFEARNRLVHGRDRYTRNMAEPQIEALIAGAKSVDSYCSKAGCPLHARMPVRRKRVLG
jgi:hypothetical protein